MSRTERNIQSTNSGRAGGFVMHIVLGIALLGVLAGGMTVVYSTATRSSAYPVCSKNARYLAESGVRYAMSELRLASDVPATVSSLNGRTFTLSSGDTFTLSIISNSPSYTVTCNASVCDGNQNAVSSLAATFTVPTAGAEEIKFEDGGIEDFGKSSDPQNDGSDGVVIIDHDTNTISIGNNKDASYDCAWYEGNATDCLDGNCTFGDGLRAYFNITFSRSSNADGFTFTVKSAETNNWRSCGGTASMGELLGYGGPGRDNRGILPPKMGVEFDIYYNGCGTNYCRSGSRCDDSNRRDHIAVLYWGANWTSCSSPTYDDNVHGRRQDDLDAPKNPDDWNNTGNGTDGYYYRTTSNSWLEDGVRVGGNWNATTDVRLEIHRSLQPNAQGAYPYTVMGWFRQQGDAIDAAFKDVKEDYRADPDLMDTVVINSSLHRALDKILFGWTVATGAQTQLGTIADFKLAFRDNNSTAWNPGVPNDYVAAWALNEGTGMYSYDLAGSAQMLATTLRYSGGQPADGEWVAGFRPLLPAFRNRRTRGRVHVNDWNWAWGSQLALTNRGSVSLWFNQLTYNNFAGLLHKGDRNDWGGRFGISSDESYGLQLYNGRLMFGLYRSRNSYVSVSSSTSFVNDLNKWHHVVATWDGTQVRLYIDGVLDASANQFNLGARIQPGGINIGAQTNLDFGDNNALDGVISQAYLYNRALTAAEVLAIYQAGTQ